MRLRLPIRVVLIFCFQLVSVFAFAQTVGGTAASDDFDGDGIINSIDLDDDNDGVLDAIESPTCFNTVIELGKPIAVSSELAPHTTYFIANSIDNSASTFSGFAPSVNWGNKEIFKFTAVDIIGITGISFDLVNWSLSTSAAMTFKLQGSSNNLTWTDLSPAASSIASTGTFTISNTLATTSKFKYYRILGVAGTSNYGGVYDARFNLATNTIPSGSPKASCSNDTDGDGVMNHLDLDSDGDGCADAIEAGTAPRGTTANTATSFLNPTTTGANGFANSLETATESGIYTGTYTYQFALFRSINTCLDTDGDGVSDLADLDDDNDGVLDTSELTCTAVATNATCLATPQAFGITTHCSGWNGFDYDPSPSVTVITNFDYMGLSNGAPYFDFQGSTRSSATSAVAGKMFKNYSTVPGMTYTFSVNLISAFVDAEGIKPYLKGVDATTGLELGATYLNGSGNRSVTFTAVGATTTISVGFDTRPSVDYVGGNQFWSEAGLTINGQAYQNCTILDTDNDGIPNHLDLDSDGDGCPDALETGISTSLLTSGQAVNLVGATITSGTTTSTLPNAVINTITSASATYGPNGFANALETTSESGLYNGTYNYSFATSKNYAACADLDGDNIPDVSDIDDDNDGVLDAIESPGCFFQPNEWNSSDKSLFATVTSDLNLLAPNNNLGALLDGLGSTTAAVQFISSPAQSQENKALLKIELSHLTQLDAIYIQKTSATQLFTGTSSLKVQGSNNNTVWTDLTAAITPPANATNVTAVGVLTLPNSNKFTLTTNPGAYKYYRIYGVTAANVSSGIASEVYFDVNIANYQASNYTKVSCENDTDGDEKYNHLDLDSDGDGCSDAFEAGTTSDRTASFAHPNAGVGTNGLVNTLETSAENGIYNGTYTYDSAVDNSVNKCTDTDNDGVIDLIDLDDDNDGVLDTTEQATCAGPAAVTLKNINGTATGVAGPNGSFPSWMNLSFSEAQPGYTLTFASPVQNIALNFASINQDDRIGDFSVKLSDGTIINKVDFNTLTSFAPSAAIWTPQPNNVENFTGNFTKNYGIPFSEGTPFFQPLIPSTQQSWGIIHFKNIPGATTKGIVELTWRMEGTSTAGLAVFTECLAYLDTDNDGIPNRLDLDSDGDGCSDAFESGATSSATGNYSFTGTMGANGLDNSLEAVADNGLINYGSTYPLAIASNYAACKDTDGDSVNDVVDIDDDNDGILDAIESPNCFFTSTEWNTADKSFFAQISSQLNTLSANTNFAGLADGIGGTTAALQFSTSPAQAQLDKEIFKITLSRPTRLDAIYIKKTSATQIFAATTASLKVQGSNNNTTWTDLTAAIASPSDATNITANGAVSLTNSNKFTLTTNLGEYKFYRIYGVVAANILSGVASEFYFDVANSSYQASYYTKPICADDADGDGLLNHQDLDADGDGCPDAREAGVLGTLTTGTITNKVNGVLTNTTNVAGAIASGTYNTNGFADALETAAESGVYSGTYLYNYARSSAVVFCTDSDSDGVLDLNDLDDDNDGVLDTTECPPFDINKLSYFPAAYTVTNGASASQTFPAAPDGLVVNVWTLDNSFNVRINGTHLTNPEELQFWTGAPSDALFEFLDGTTYSAVWGIVGNKNKPLIRIYIDKVGQIKVYGSRTSGGELEEMRLRNGSFNTVILNTNTTNTFQIGQAVVAQTFISGDYGVITPPACDDDNDGIPNGLDLDSDGDGCPDAKEAGVNGTLLAGDIKNGANGAVTSTTNLPNAIAGSAGNYGANGLADVVETSNESGAIRYTSNYTNFARSSTLNVCIDTDADGVADVLDIDDDNDGILDTVEQISCSGTGANLSPLTFSGTAVTTKTANTITASNTNAWLSSYSTENFSLPLSLKFKRPTIGNQAMFGLIPVNGTQTPTNWNDDGYKFFFTSTNVNVPYGMSSNVVQTATAEDEYSIDISTTGFVTIKINDIQRAAFQGVNSSYKLAVSGLTTTVFTDIRLSNPTNPLVIRCTDTDNDGVPNHLDLDSDGDGCADAIEAGSSTTTTSTSVFPTGTDTNANGFLNSYESNTAGTINYVSTYVDYALINTINACLDSDSDGVKDIVDIDDDNDGVLDVTEMTCTSTLLSYDGVTISKPNTINYTFNGALTLNNLIDGVDNNNYVARAPTGTLNGEWFRIALPTLKVLNYVEIGHYNGQTLFAVGSTYKVEGSLDGVNWTNVSGTLTYNNDNNPVNGRYSTFNSNAAVFNNKTAYFYYRLVGINATNGGTWATELYFNQRNCTDIDTDDDGIPNRLELDSDGDGCSDAKEAGSTTSSTSNYVFTGAFGANGFADGLETATESGNFSGTYTYSYAANPLINACLDYDSDGAIDFFDIDDDNDGALDVIETSCTSYAYTGSNTSITVPAGAVSMEVKMWGAGGGGSNTSNSTAGSGAYVFGKLNVTPNETLTLIVGQGGVNKSSVATYGGGGAGGNDPFQSLHGGSGGGRSELRRGSTSLLIAGGGGGAAGSPTNRSYAGGAGIRNGQDGIANVQVPTGAGKGGTQVAGGSGGTITGVTGFNGANGAQFVGGNGGVSKQANAGAGGGGGGGWYGGGGGAGNGFDPYQENAAGGGSSYFNVALLQKTGIAGNTNTVGGSTTSAPNNTDPAYVAGVGAGGAANTAGGNGLVQVCYTYDTDGDGVANQIDLDSDGDGCSDAFEAGSFSAPSSTSTIPTGADTNANGLLNSYEGTTAGTIKYISRYSQYALNNLNSACLDSDTDGVPDVNDIDDDNDGVLDVTEYNCEVSTMSKTGITVSSTVTWGYNSTVLNNLVDGTENLVIYPNGEFLNETIFQFNLPSAKVLEQIEISTQSGLTTLGTTGTYNLEGWNGSTWVVIEKNKTFGGTSSPIRAPGNTYKFYMPNNLTAYTKYRIFGTSIKGTYNSSSWVQEAYFFERSCNTDVDNDGIKNWLDLDSDGDGCPDAKEASVTGTLSAGTIQNLTGSALATTSNVASAIASGTYGANGFANGLETSLESGIYSGTYTYNFAVDAAINNCIDTDNDGVPNPFDLDDDNDGVLDVTELNCATSIVSKTGITVSSTVTWGYNGSSTLANLVNGLEDLTAYASSDFIDRTVLQFDLPSAKALSLIEISTQNSGATLGTSGKYNLQGWNGTKWVTILSNQTFAMNAPVLAQANSYTFKMPSNTTAYTKYRIFGLSTKGPDNSIAGWIQEAYFTEQTCNLDSDGDGTPNTQDTDSDGDGCSDAVEAGTVTGTSATTVTGNYGANGFVNSLETATESGIYSGTYSYQFATDPTFSSCRDTDGDGVTDVNDIDDDNDGVLDSVECPSTQMLTNGDFSNGTTGWTVGSGWTLENGTMANYLDGVTNSMLSQTIARPYPTTRPGYVDFKVDVRASGYNNVQSNAYTASLIMQVNGVKYAALTNPSGNATASVQTFNGAISSVSTFPVQLLSGPLTTVTISIPSSVFFASNQVGIGFTAGNDDFTIDNVSLSTSSSLAACDLDGDGIPNSRDLDSDGDGCSDASEAKTVSTLTASTVSGAVGNNGFANSIETTTESGLYSGTYLYSRALDPTIKACLDSDYDGVADLDDVDDDNDGLLDASECSVALFIENTPSNLGQVSRKSWTFSSVDESSVNSFAGGSFGAGRAEATQVVYGEVKLPPAATTNIQEPLTSLDFPSLNQGTVIYREFYVKIPATAAFTNASQIAFRIGNSNSTWNVAMLYVSHKGASITTPKQGGGGSNSLLLTTNRDDLKLISQTKFNTVDNYIGGAFITSAANAGKWVRMAVAMHDGGQFEQATVQYSLVSPLTSLSAWSPVDVANGFQFAASGMGTSLDDSNLVCDFDGDGIPNTLDLDSDGDGCSDANEAYGLTTAQGTDGNQYFGNSPLTVDATGRVSGATYTATSVNVLTAGSASSITVQPTDQSINVGGTAVFSTALTTGSGTTSYQWQVSTNGGTTWSNVTNSSTYAGAGTMTLTVSNVPLSMKGFRYRLNVAQSNYVCGNITSSVARLTMDNTPIVVDDNATGTEDTPISGNVLTNDRGSGIPAAGITVTNFIINNTTYTAGQTASISGVGSITINTDGSYTFTPTANYNGTLPLIEYTATDANGGTDVGALNITVTPVNDAPVAVDDIKTTNENTTASGNVLTDGTDDSDVDGNTLTITEFKIGAVSYNPGSPVSIPGVGTILLTTSGSYTFTPTAGYTGSVPGIDYKISDGNGGSDTGTLSITVNNVNDAPLATDDIVTMLQGGIATGSVLTNDTDVDAGTTLSVTQFSYSINGTTYTQTAGPGVVTLTGIGTIIINTNGTYTFTPDASFTGTVPHITYTISDGTLTDTALLDIFVAPVNALPVAVDDVNTTPEDTPVSGNVVSNDTDANSGDPKTVVGFTVGGQTYPAGSTAIIAGVGTIVINANGSYTFTPFTNYNGTVPAVSYTVSDGNGGTDSGDLVITVTAVNDNPIAVNDDNKTTPEDTAVMVNVLLNDSDPDGGGTVLTVTQFTISGISGTFTSTATIPGKGTITALSTGEFTFTPFLNFNGVVPTITYTVSDGTATNTANFNLTVTPVNDAPVVVNETLTTPENTPLSGNLLSNDTDVESNTLSITQFTISGVGTATAATYPAGSIVDIPNVGTVIVNEDGTFTFTPVRGYFGTPPVITYAVSDGNGGTTNGTLAITVNPVNDPPVVVNESVQILEDAVASGNLLSNDTDPENNPLTITQFTIAGISGTFTSTASIPGVGTITINANGTYTFTPTANYNGIVPVIEYTVSDGLGGNSTGNLTIVVAAVNDAPIVANDTKSAPVNTPIADNVLTNDRDVEASALSLTKFTIAGIDYLPGATATITGVGTIVMNADGTFTFTPATNYVGSAPLVTYTVSDGTATSTGTLSLTITPIDADGDGIPDEIEKGPGSTPRDTDNDGMPDYLDTDSDGDGILDNAEDAVCVGFMPCTPTDTDGDGTPDYRDLDSDGDGIPDATEGTTDTDGDGVPNYRDTDSDGDGILDSIEGITDTDGDGVPNYKDLDSDGDGIPDATEGTTDTDGDGTPNYKDLDSDADGITDAIEGTTDTDGDGTPNYIDTDSDGDGISDAIEKGPTATPVDTDGDGTPDYKDLDSDNDGILDSAETATDTDGDGVPNFRDLDSDGDGILDAVEGTTDTDGDGTPNYLDVDSDGDGIPDSIEKGPGSVPVDTDGDGTPDYKDVDTDGDGIPDAIEDTGCTGTAPCVPTDTDGDGTPNFRDLDSDGDGITDAIEKGANGSLPADTDSDGTPDYLDLDSDGDGISDAIEKGPNATPIDTDGDGIPDFRDTDSDNDGISDAIEKGPDATPVDTDGDGTPDYRDLDSDGDGKSDQSEGNVDTDNDGTPNFRDLDSDGDGVLDAVDVCPLISGLGSANGCPPDSDGDGLADVDDSDDDNDGILDTVEAAACSPSAVDCDTDGDGIPNRLDADSDGDGISDVVEAGGTDADKDGKADGAPDVNGIPASASGGLTPSNTDGTGNSNPYDTDSDGDGILDAIEKGTGATLADTDNDTIPDYLDLDSDGDGISDAIEKGTGTAVADTDNDGTPDFRDLDSDGDGIPDAIEGTTDSDNDGTPNYRDVDSDGDGILDSIEKGTGMTLVDSDGDNIPNYLDADSDADGIPDAIEGTVDTDIDGTPDYLDTDSDGDGILDSVEDAGCTGTAPCVPTDTDGDGVPNFRDLDSDGDGITDAIEGTTNTDGDLLPNYLDPDSDGDGISDLIEGNVDTDGDGTPNYKDLDSDGDGIPDSIEKGTATLPADTDGDGTPDYLDTDTDGDGIPDSVEDAACSGTTCTPTDTDGDGIPNHKDLDSDNDGIPDSVEKGASGASPDDTDGTTLPNYLDTDSDDDGILDAVERGIDGNNPLDTDSDGIPDYKEVDSDNDGIPDAIEGTVDTDGDGTPDYRDTDSDNDGILDATEDVGCTGTAPCTPTDTDNDGTPNYKDLDSDGDNKSDRSEGETDFDGDGTPNYLDLDSDGDGVLDIVDQCPLLFGLANLNGCPVDTDGDGVYDVDDADDDNDGLLDTVEAGVCSPTAPDCDTDSDGIPNRLDPDSDNDGISDVRESNGTDVDGDGKVDGTVDANGVPSSTNGGLTPPNTDGTTLPDPYDLDSDGDGIPDSLEGTVDTDGDGIPNYRDLDSDGDGIPDSVERGTGAAILDTDGDGTPDYKDLDSDGDGISDSIEKGPNGATPLDTDGDGIPNYRDLDSDGDGIPDNIEGTIDTDGDGIPNYRDTDSDGDGISDAIEKGLNGNSPIDTDGDGVPDYRDLDSDNDGIPDSVEGSLDRDGDGVPNYRDLDSDGDGITDAVEKGLNGATPVDTDLDGTPDYLDLDSDGDGKSDAIEKGTGSTLLDTDRDGIPDYRDVDNYGKSDFNVTNVNVPVSGNVKTNDTVPTGTTYGQPAALAGATLVMNAATGTYTFTSTTPGKYVYYIPVCGPTQTSNCPQTPLEITVLDPLAVDKPAANNDFAILEQGGSATVAILANDKAGDLGKSIDAASLVISIAPGHGTAVVNSDGTITYTPSAYFVGVDSLVYRVCDTNVPSQCQSATAYFTIEPAGVLVSTGVVDDFAILRGSTDGSTSVTGNVLSNDLNGAGASLTANLISGPSSAQGTFTMNASGNYTFTAAPGFSGPVDIVYEACGGSPVVCTKATLHILVDPVPALVNDVTTAFANVPKTGNLSTNETVPAGTTYGQPAALTGATITVGPSGTYTFTATVAGTYTYTIPTCAPGQTSNCPTQTLVITVTAPGPVDDTATAFANVAKTGSIATNDTNPAGTTFGQPAPVTGATITVNPDGTYSFTATAAGTYTYTIPTCAPGQTSNCPTQTLVITVTAPGPVNDVATALVNTPATGNVATNDNNPAGTTFSQPAPVEGATIVVNPDGTYIFSARVAGTFTYTIPTCAPGQTSNCPTQTLAITVIAPQVTDDTATAFANVAKTGNIATNDNNPAGTTFGQPAQQTGATITVNPDGTYSFTATQAGTYTYTIPTCAPGQTSNCPTQTLVITVTAPQVVDDTETAFANVAKTGNIATNDTNPAGSTYGQPAPVTGATITVNPDGTYSFTATAAGTYTYTIPTCAPGQTSNCPTQTLVITVTAPGPVDDTATAFANVAKSGNIATNDSNPAGTTYGQPAPLTGATITINPDGTYSFTATASGTYTYTIPTCAPGQTSNCPTQTLVITVTAPQLTDDTATAFANVPKTGNIATNDTNPAGSTYGQPAQQTGATITVNPDGTYSFTATQAGTYSYTIPTCAPGQTSNCPTQTLVITVTAPQVTNDTAATTKNTPITGNVATNDVIPAGTTYGQPAQQTGATITVNPDGTYSFTATAAGTYTYSIAVCAPGQTSNCPTQTLAITVTDPTVPYSAPTTNPDIDATNINVPVSGNVSTNDAAGATYAQPAQQTGATITVNANGSYSFTATIPGVYTYQVPVCPTGVTSNCPSVPLVITVSDPLKASNSPVANADLATVNAGSSVTTKVLANDKAANAGTSLNPASLTIVTNGANGTAVVNADGTITYTPKVGFTGVDEITYRVCDNSTPALCSTAKVVYTIQPVTEPAKTFATDDYNSTPAGSSVTGSVLANDGNTAGESVSATIVSGPAASEGTLVFNANGTYTFTPAPGFSGPVDVVYTVCSVSNVCSKATLHLVVNPPPVLIPDFNATLVGLIVEGNVATNDVIAAGSTYGQPDPIIGANLVMNPDGTYSFDSDVPGTYEYLVPVCAKGQITNCPRVTLVISVTDPYALTNTPVVNPDIVSVAAGATVTTNVLANDQATNDGKVLVISTLAIVTGPTNGTAKVNVDGTITYTPAPGFVGVDILTYTICDNSQPAYCKTAKVYYTVGLATGKNLSASDDFAISKGGQVGGNVLGNDKSSSGSALTATAITNVDPSKGTFTLSPSGEYKFTPSAGFVGPVDIVYSVCSADGLCTKATLHITVLPVPEMIAPQAITPNGDGKNDTLIFRGLVALNIENRLTIYNRWGNIVFSTGNYQNNWSGQTDNAFSALASDSQLPDGTYYYVLDFFGSRPSLSNYVYLDRSSK